MSILRVLYAAPMSKSLYVSPALLQRLQPTTLIPPLRCQSTKIDDTEGDLVYRGTISSMVRNVKLLSLLSSAVGLGLQPYLYYHAENLGSAGIIVGGIFSFFIFGTPLLLHIITKKYVTELYMKPEEHEFTAYTWTFLLRKRKVTFTPNDVIQPGVPGPFSTIMVKGRPLFMDPSFFTDPSAYRTMMGYNKPVDWSFPEEIDDLDKTGKDCSEGKSAGDEINERK